MLIEILNLAAALEWIALGVLVFSGCAASDADWKQH